MIKKFRGSREKLKIISEKKDSEEVDWLELVNKKNDLKKFFVD